MATTAVKPIAGIGRVYFLSGGSLWLGRDAGRGHPHSHHAIQITLALEGRLRLRELRRMFGIAPAMLIIDKGDRSGTMKPLPRDMMRR
jgi:hypothetical protein